MYKSLLGMFVIFASIAESGSPFTGVWEASLNDQPAIELTINEMDGKIGGTIVFYLQRRGDDGKWRVEGGRNPTTRRLRVSRARCAPIRRGGSGKPGGDREVGGDDSSVAARSVWR